MPENKILNNLQPNDDSIGQPKYTHSTISHKGTDIDKIHRKLHSLEQRFETLETNLNNFLERY